MESVKKEMFVNQEGGGYLFGLHNFIPALRHTILIEIVKLYGVSEDTCKWFRSYLEKINRILPLLDLFFTIKRVYRLVAIVRVGKNSSLSTSDKDTLYVLSFGE